MHFTTSRESLRWPEPSFGLVDWRDRDRASSCAGSRGGVEGGLSKLEVLDMGGMEGSAYQAAPALWRSEPMMNGGETWRSPISRELRSSHTESRHQSIDNLRQACTALAGMRQSIPGEGRRMSVCFVRTRYHPRPFILFASRCNV